MTVSDAKIERQKNGRVVCSVTFPADQVKPAEERAFALLAESIKVPGFRPGKAPREKLLEKIDQDQVLEHTVRSLVGVVMEQLITEHKIQTIISPRIAVRSRDPLIVDIVFVEKPTVTMKGADKIKIEKKKTEVKEEDVEKMAQYILQKHETAQDADRPAADKDRVTVDFWGADGEGKEIPEIRTTGHAVMLGSSSLIPGFEEALTGMKKGEEKSFTLTFPEKYHAEQLQGKPVTFHVTLKRVEEVRIPELTDAFATEHLGVTTAKEFRDKLKESMIAQEERIDRQRREQQLMDAIRKATRIELPTELIDEEVQSLLEDFAGELKRQNMTIGDWMDRAKKKPEEFEKELKQQAQDRLALRLGIRQLIDDRQIVISDEETDRTVTELLAPLSEKERKEVESSYAKGGRAREQLQWQKKVEKLFSTFLD